MTELKISKNLTGNFVPGLFSKTLKETTRKIEYHVEQVGISDSRLESEMAHKGEQTFSRWE